MLYQINGDCIKEENGILLKDTPYFCIISGEKLGSAGKKLGMHDKFIKEYQRNTTPKFESHDGFDYLLFNIPDKSDQKKPVQRVCIYSADNRLVFVCDTLPIIRDIVSELKNDGCKNLSLGRILYLFLDKLTVDDTSVLESIEQEITELEESLTTSSNIEISNKIILLRRKLLSLKRYYEQVLEIAEEIEQNENEFLDKKILRYFRMITNRIDRLYHNVLNLRDYVTQVREAYQAQVDIDLNSIMKLFTVITSIFLPLTLIVGWYGMNVKMPEYGWAFGYVFVIGISIAAAGFTIAYFKKKKWF